MGNHHSRKHHKRNRTPPPPVYVTPPVTVTDPVSPSVNQPATYFVAEPVIPVMPQPIIYQVPQEPVLQPSSDVVYQQQSAYFNPQNSVPENAMEMFRIFAEKFGIKNDFLRRLRTLDDFKIIILCDDSGSMKNNAYDKEFIRDVFQRYIPSRFEELKSMVELVLKMSGVLSKDSIDLYFLNRPGKQNIKTFEEAAYLFQNIPDGGTPTLKILRQIINEKAYIMSEKNLLIFIATDGQPTDHHGNHNFPQLANYIGELMNTYPNLYITFMACVSDESLLKNMDQLGEKLTRVGVVDEFNVEFKEMMEKHGSEPGFTFTMGEYITKALLVSIDPEIKAQFRDDSSSSS